MHHSAKGAQEGVQHERPRAPVLAPVGSPVVGMGRHRPEPLYACHRRAERLVMRRLRVLVLVLAEHPRGPRILMVKDLSTGGWSLPGAEVPEGEAIPDTGARVLERQTGLALRLARVLAFDQSPGGTFARKPETLTVVLDGGLIGEERARTLAQLPSKVGTLLPMRWVKLAEVETEPGHLKHALVASARGLHVSPRERAEFPSVRKPSTTDARKVLR
jgi:ADP-ribose pyrophosphatase YjhB (NUDIX family)